MVVNVHNDEKPSGSTLRLRILSTRREFAPDRVDVAVTARYVALLQRASRLSATLEDASDNAELEQVRAIQREFARLCEDTGVDPPSARSAETGRADAGVRLLLQRTLAAAAILRAAGVPESAMRGLWNVFRDALALDPTANGDPGNADRTLSRLTTELQSIVGGARRSSGPAPLLSPVTAGAEALPEQSDVDALRALLAVPEQSRGRDWGAQLLEHLASIRAVEQALGPLHLRAIKTAVFGLDDRDKRSA